MSSTKGIRDRSDYVDEGISHPDPTVYEGGTRTRPPGPRPPSGPGIPASFDLETRVRPEKTLTHKQNAETKQFAAQEAALEYHKRNAGADTIARLQQEAGPAKPSAPNTKMVTTAIPPPSTYVAGTSAGARAARLLQLKREPQSIPPCIGVIKDGASKAAQVQQSSFNQACRDLEILLDALPSRKCNINSDQSIGTESAATLCGILLDSASSIKSSDPTQASELLKHARFLGDLATDFTPGISLGKDVLSLATRVNPITGERIGDVEMGLLAAGIIVPGALKGTAKGVAKAAKALASAVAHNGHYVAAARRLAEPMRKAEKLIDALRAASSEVGEFGPEGMRRLAQAADHAREVVEKSAAQLRRSSGRATITKELFDPEKMLNGTHGNAGLVPKDVAERLVGKEFRSFDHFREEFWKAVSKSKYSEQFASANRVLMAKGKSPRAHSSQGIVSKVKEGDAKSVYELHHMTPIQHGGSVYDLSNILISTPRFHAEVLDTVFHYKGF